MQGTWVRAPVREDPTCCGAASPVSHGPEPARPDPVLRNGRGHNSERPAYREKKDYGTRGEGDEAQSQTQEGQVGIYSQGTE